jgi:hypothetical protein
LVDCAYGYFCGSDFGDFRLDALRASHPAGITGLETCATGREHADGIASRRFLRRFSGQALRKASGLAFDVTSRPFVKPQGSASIPSRLVSARFEMTQTEHRFALIPRLRQPPLGMTDFAGLSGKAGGSCPWPAPRFPTSYK